ncbi:accessory factor UbiK family protein [Acidocella aromatica]|uniref:BMFP domain-containing protein YqiC n=1 Tax=Acidocella aromatica TaxID=1303579 RepID=A0A840VI24_9PROT|nr:BMFP domain-containing protein YqiC [Acidocella aromatica]
MTNIICRFIWRTVTTEKARPMTERPKFFDDLAGVAGGAISALAGVREEVSSLVRARVDEAVRRLDLVKREEFEAMAELARRAKAEVEALERRVAALESGAPETDETSDLAS